MSATLEIDCYTCCGDGYVEHYDYGFPGGRCDACEGRGWVEAFCDVPRCNSHAVTGVEGEYLCAFHAADLDLVVPVTVPSLAGCREGVWL